MPGKIFISYRREDAAANALGIGQYLEREFGRKNVFIDVDMRAGVKFPTVLEQRLAQCKVMLVLIGPDWLNSRDQEGGRRLDAPDDWVRLEIAHALKRDITVIPVRVGGANLPLKADLPDDIKGLLDHQAISVTIPGFRHEMSGLVRDIRAIPRRKLQRRLGPVPLALIFITIALFVALVSFVNPIDRVRALIFPRRALNVASNDVWDSRPGEWVLYGVDKQPVAYFFKSDTLQFFGGKVAFISRYPFKSVALNSTAEQGSFQSAYEDDIFIIDCGKSLTTVAEKTVYNKKNEIISHYKKGDVATIDLSSADPISPDSLLAPVEHMFCDEKLRSPVVDDPRTAALYLSPLGVQGAELFYSPPDKITTTEYSSLLVTKFYGDHLFSDMFPKQEIVGLPHSFRSIGQPIKLNCITRKIETPKSEYFDADNKLESIWVPPSAPILDAKDGSPLDLLISKVCNIKNVAGKYEGTNYETLNGGEGNQKIAITVEQTGNQLKIIFQTPRGGQGEGTGVLEGTVIKEMTLKSTSTDCPGSYEGSLEFNDDGSLKWSFKGQDCGGPIEGQGTAIKTKG